MTIVPAVPADVPELNKLINSAYRGDSSRRGWTTEADLLGGIRIDESTLHQYISETGSVILACRDDAQKLIGCVYLKTGAEHLYLGMLTVSPQLQGAGIGKLLLNAAEAKAKETSQRKILMTVISLRRELIDWYKRRGYYETGQTQPFGTNKTFGDPAVPLEFLFLEKVVG